MKEVLAIAKREFRLIWQDSRLRGVVLAAPFLYALLFCFVYMGHSVNEVAVGVLQEDPGSLSRTLVRMLEASPKLSVKRQVYSVEELKDLIYDRTLDAAIVIPADYTLRLKRGHDVHVTAYVNAASMVTANTAAKAINEVVQTYSAGVEIRTLMKKGERLDSAMERMMPVKLDLRSLFNPSFNYSNFMVPGLLITILQQVILLGVALSWAGERENRTLSSLLGLSRKPWALFVGKALPYFLINALVSEFYLRVLFPLNDIPMEGNWLVAVPFTFLFVITVVAWGMWVSGLCNSRLFATQVLMFVAMPSFVLSGFTWPREAMPAFIQFLGSLLPMTHFVNSFRAIYLGGAPLAYVYGDILILSAFLVVNVVASLVVISRLIRTAVPA